MSDWTHAARIELENYCARARLALAGTGADAMEVIDDLRRHVASEIAEAGIRVVTGPDVQRILARLGEPAAVLVDRPAQPISRPEPEPLPAIPRPPSKPSFGLLLAVAILPLATFFFELFTEICATVLFDPIPSLWHAAAILSVPALNGALWWILRHPESAAWTALHKGDARAVTFWSIASGITITVAGYYAILLIPATPYGAFGFIVFGLGLLVFAPAMAVPATVCLRRHLKSAAGVRNLPRSVTGIFAGIGLLLLIELPDLNTQIGLQMATQPSASTRAFGLRWLRVFGSEARLLELCYVPPKRTTDLISMLIQHRRAVLPDQAREAFFRVTGKPFNTLPPPRLRGVGPEGRFLNELAFDNDTGLGGESVAGRVRGLSLSSSRLDGLIEPVAALGYLEWTLEFKNDATIAREARAQIQLPPGGVVSRLTLWVNGEEREAAFAGRSQVREAYEKVAVIQRRDPVLVTTSGPDRVLMQCFPVPPGGSMKVRLGVTAPLVLRTDREGVLLWPEFLERNFAIADEFRHHVWIESPGHIEGPDSLASLQAPGKSVVRGELPESAFDGAPQHVQVRRPDPFPATLGTALDPDQRALQWVERSLSDPAQRIVLALDGSAGMAGVVDGLADELDERDLARLTVLVAADEQILQWPEASGSDDRNLPALQKWLRRVRTGGGQDNVPLLTRAWDLAAAEPNSAIVWIHGPQPVLLGSAPAVRQRLERAEGSTRLYDLQVRRGPNRIAEELEGLTSFRVVRWLESPGHELTRILQTVLGRLPEFRLAREFVESGDPQYAGASESLSKHLARLAARDAVLDLINARQFARAVALAANYQLVTPVSGAVVLETQQQYDEAGLTPVDSLSVPTVPEPSTWALMILGVAVLLTLSWKPRRTSSPARL